MNKKQLFLILGVGALIVIAAVMVNKQRSAVFHTTSADGTKLLPSFDPNAVARVVLKSGPDNVSLVRSNQSWAVEERGGYAADFAKVAGLLRKVWELKPIRAVQVGPSRLAALNLEGTDKGSTLLELRGEGDAVIHSILLGTNMVSQSEAGSDSRYVMVDGKIDSVCLVGDAFAEVEISPKNWLKTDFIKVENPVNVSVVSTNATDSWTLKRQDPSAAWVLVDAKEGETIDEAQTGSLSQVLSSARINDVVIGGGAAASGLDRPIRATIETQDGFTYVLEIGAEAEGNRPIRVKVTAALNSTRKVGDGEKAEEKEKLDKAFAENQAKLKAKLEREQLLEKWTFLVSSWSVDSLIKPRGDLLKKPEPAAANTPAAGNPEPK